MSHCKHIVQQLSDFQEGALSAKAHQEVVEHLAGCAECSLADRNLRRTVKLLTHMPMPEPRLDLWGEFSVKMAAFEEEQRMGVARRLVLYWHHAISSLAEGAVLYTHAVAHRTLANMERYLVRDPFQVID